MIKKNAPIEEDGRKRCVYFDPCNEHAVFDFGIIWGIILS